MAFSFEQTTYENFRYRYDKKENPYNNGMINNLREIFFSNTPPSLNDFRALVQECEHVGKEPTTPNLDGSHSSSKEKIDIEMGNKLAETSGFSLPEILRNMDYEDVEDNARGKVGNGRLDTNPFFLNVEQDPIDYTESFNAEHEFHTREN